MCSEQCLNLLKEKYENLLVKIEEIRNEIEALPEHDKQKVDELATRAMRMRKIILKIFSKEKFKSACGECKGGCCKLMVGLSLDDILFNVALPKEMGLFVLPKLDLEYIKSKDCCIFLSKEGCMLEKWRPLVCLAFAFCEQFRNMAIPSVNEKNRIWQLRLEAEKAVKEIKEIVHNNGRKNGKGSIFRYCRY